MVESRLSNTASSPRPEVLYAPVGNPNCWLYAAWPVMTGGTASGAYSVSTIP